MAKNYEITRVESFKNYIFCLSVVNYSLGVAAMFTTHSVENWNGKFSIAEIKRHFQKAHNKQIRAMIKKEELNEPAEFRIHKVEDLTKQSLKKIENLKKS